MKKEDIRSRVESRVRNHIKDGDPGVALLIGEKGRIVYRGAFGMDDREERVPLSPNRRFFIASVSKQFTTMALMILKERGSLDYDRPIREFFPDFPAYADRVTVRHLMTHTSGMREYFTEEFIQSVLHREEMELREILDHIRSLGDLEFEPGTRFRYCNSAYVLLGALVERLSGLTFSEFLRQNILVPLGMTDTLVPQDARTPISNLAKGYSKGLKGNADLQPAPFCMAMVGWADGNVVTTLDDLFRWHNALSAGALVGKETFQEAVTSYRLLDGSETGYGFGWFLNVRRGLVEQWHTGGTVGYTSHFSRFPAEGACFILLSNSEIRREELFGEIVESCMEDRLAPVPYVQVSQADLERECGLYSAEDKKCSVLLDSVAGKLRAECVLDHLEGSYGLSPLGKRRFRIDSPVDYYVNFEDSPVRGKGMIMYCNGLPIRLRREE